MITRWLAVALLVSVSAPTIARAQAGWRELDLGGGRRATRFLPASARACDPQPMLLFLHSAGGTPEAYVPHLEPHAEALGMVLLLPQASGAGWSGADGATLNDALDALAPIRMYYGDTDPNFTGGSAMALASQWDRLGVPNETDVQAGFGHSTWPASSIRSGF